MRWFFLPYREEAKELVKHLDLHPLIGQLLFNRGITTPSEAEKFLYPTLGDLANPFLLKGMEEAVQRVAKAIINREPIMIYGDYDVDGLTATALLKAFLSKIGVEAAHYIPKRLEEGYGLNAEAVKAIASLGIKLLITVDCGISNREEIALAKRLGMDVVVIDHHEPPADLPQAVIIDPLQRGCPFPFKGLTAVGLSFMFLLALRRYLRERGFFKDKKEPNLKKFLDLVALGTIADVAPLLGENRILVKFGLKELEETNRPGIKALKELAGLKEGQLTYELIAFRLAPRLNAGGRMQKEEVPLKVLLTEDEGEAVKLAQELEEANRLRQLVQEEIYHEARLLALEQRDHLAIVIAKENWHPGVIGIVASKLAEEFYRPTVLIALEGEKGKGSARGIPEIHLRELLEGCRDFLLDFGGHKQAAGLTIKREFIDAFADALRESVKRTLGDDLPSPSLLVDASVSLRDLNPQLLGDLELLSPFGPANAEPTFATAELVSIDGIRRYEKDVVRFSVASRGRRFEAVTFSLDRVSLPSQARIAFTPRKELMEGYIRLTLEVKGIKEI